MLRIIDRIQLLKLELTFQQPKMRVAQKNCSLVWVLKSISIGKTSSIVGTAKEFKDNREKDIVTIIY